MITVLIANHNYGEYLEECINSVKGQTLPCRICFIDDGSTDDSLERAKSLLREEDILIEIKSSKGPSHARNEGIRHTIHNTEFYIVLDADDIMMPNKVEELYSQYSLNKQQIGVVYADYIIFDNNGNERIEIKEPYSMKRLYQECIVHSGAGISSLALQSVCNDDGFFNESMRTAEDYELWVRISKKFMIMHIPKILTKVRVHPNNSTNTVDNKIWMENWNKVKQAINNA